MHADAINETRQCRVAGSLVLLMILGLGGTDLLAQALPGGTLDPATVPKYQTNLVIPPVMPPVLPFFDSKYVIAAKQFKQQVLPIGYGKTTVWGYGSVTNPSTFNWPAYTVEARANEIDRVTWINGLVDSRLKFLPHLLPVDQTLHWANPAQDCMEGPPRPDCHGMNPVPYTGPVPLVTHLHGAHVDAVSDGYPEAWTLPQAVNIPPGYATRGSNFSSVRPALPGSFVYEYDNSQRATTLWYHDHTLGMTRLNVYAGLAGFWLIRDEEEKSLHLPGPAPKLGQNPNNPLVRKTIREIPVLIQDRSFNADGSFFYPQTRAFFEGVEPEQLQIPLIPDGNNDIFSDISPIWNPEAFFNTMTVNGRTWPKLDVEPDLYRFRILNGSNSRFLILKIVAYSDREAGRPVTPRLDFTQIGSDGGLLPAPVTLGQLLMGPAERADVIVDFRGLPRNTQLALINEGPDEPFGGGEVGVDFAAADPGTTGQVMKFTVVRNTPAGDGAILPTGLPAIEPLDNAVRTRQVSLNEEESETICTMTDNAGNIIQIPCGIDGPFFAPKAAKLGTVEFGGGVPKPWADLITENPLLGDTEIWEIYNFTEDAHPIHLHLVQFQIINREGLSFDVNGVATPNGDVRDPEAWETGRKDMVIVYPGELARVKATFDRSGLYVWHCHILEHEDNEMMRPYYISADETDTPPSP